MKPFWSSKTFLLNLIPLVASVNEIVIDLLSKKCISTQTSVIAGLSVMNIILRFISSDKVTLK